MAIPQGAAKRGFRFRLHRGPGDEPNLDPNLQVLDARAAIEAPDAPPLDKPARVTLSFDGKLPAGVDAKRIVPVVHNGLFWEKVYSAKIDPSAQTASFDIPWLGTAAIALDRFETMLVRHHEWEKLLEMEGAPNFIVEYAPGTPASPDREYLDVILATLYRCHDVFVRELKYDPPPISPIVVRVCDLNAEQVMKAMDRRFRVMGMASLAGFHREIAGGIGQMLITSTLRDGNALRAAVAHEYFHLLQAAALRRNNVPLERVKDAMVRDLGESQWWFRDKGSNRWLLDSPPHMKRVAMKDRRKGSLALGVVKPLGTGPLLRLDHDKAKPLNVTLRLKPYAGYSARDDAGMVAVVFADEQRIVRAQPMSGAGGTIRVPAKTASHLVVVPLNVHGYREYPMTLEWTRPRESGEGVYVRGPVRILQQTLRPDVKCTFSVNGNSATVVFVDPKTGRKEWSTFQWEVPPEKLRLEERFALVLRGSHRVEPKPKPKPAPAPPRPIEDNRTFRAGTPERPIILNGKDQGSPEGVLWFCTGRMFLPLPAQTIGPSAADLRSYLSNVLNFSSAPSFGLKEPRPKVHPGRFSLSPDVTCSRIILPPQPRRYEQLFSAEDEGASRVGIYITGEQENRLGFAAVIFWDYTELESAVAGPGT